ncbi:MAG: Alanyl dipeptidyl peptidase [Ignavibacteriae bacterium]|nr:MAG: Alanyl dipeptidyl peptidase [Ignavibacteriota bacterium]
MILKKCFFIIILVSIFINFLYSDNNKRPFTPQDLWKLKRLSSLTVSPDGRFSAFTVTSYDIEENKGTSNIWLVDNETAQIQQLTTFKAMDGSPAWSPDGKKIAFTSKREGDYAQLYIIPGDGGEAIKITDMPLGVSSPKWFPDGKRIAFAANVIPELTNNLDSMKKVIEQKKKSKVTAKASESRLIRYWDRWLTEGYYPRLFSVDIETKKVTDLLPDWKNYFDLMEGADYDISPDGKEIAFAGNSTTEPYDSLNMDIFLVPTDGSGKLTNITSENSANDFGPRYSNNGEFLIYGMQKIRDFYADKVRLIKYEKRSGKKIQITPETYDRTPEQWRLTKDDRTIFYSVEDRAKKSIFKIDIDGKNIKEIVRLGTCNLPHPLKDGRVVFLNQTFYYPNEIFITGKGGKDIKKLTAFNDELLNKITMAEAKEYYFIGADGDSVQMYVLYPYNFDPTKKWPLLQIIHGGPHSISGDDFHFRWNPQLFAAPGYVVALVNFHGSTSFGQYFADCINGAHPEKPFEDIMKATDFLIAKGYVDSTKMAAAGGSYGGYLVSWIAGHTNRFAALINHAGVYNLMAQFASDVTYGRERAYGGSPWYNKQNVQKWSPAEFAENFNTPMLVIHGERDYRVPINHALECYGVLKGKGIPARLVYFPDENHWILTPQNSIYWYKEFYDWLKRFIGN